MHVISQFQTQACPQIEYLSGNTGQTAFRPYVRTIDFEKNILNFRAENKYIYKSHDFMSGHGDIVDFILNRSGESLTQTLFHIEDFESLL